MILHRVSQLIGKGRIMKWNVYYHDINRDKMEVFNIFDHSSFCNDIKKYLKEYTDKEKFEERLKRSLSYYFWCKAEWEIVISPWVGGRNTKEVKIDVYDQVMNNWDVFVDCVWKEKNNGYNS